MKMRSLLFLLLLPLAATAGWEELAADAVAREYVNLDTVEKRGNVIAMWNMSDFHVPQAVGNGRTYLSSKVHQEYDCLSKRKRIITLIHYQERQGQGQMVFFDKTLGDWRVVKPGSLADVHLNAACLASLDASKDAAKLP